MRRSSKSVPVPPNKSRPNRRPDTRYYPAENRSIAVAKPWKPDTAGAIARNEALRVSRCFGRTIWRRWSGYHRRSRVETKMHCVKLLGQHLMARDFDRQIAEFHVSCRPERLHCLWHTRP